MYDFLLVVFHPARNFLPSCRHLQSDTRPIHITSLQALVVNSSIVNDLTIWQPGFDLTSAQVANNKQHSTLSAAAYRPSWRVICSGFTRLIMLQFNGWQLVAREAHNNFLLVNSSNQVSCVTSDMLSLA